MLADCFTNSVPKPAFLKQCAAMGTIVMGLGNSIGTANVIRNAVGKQIDIFGTLFVLRRCMLFDWLLFSYVYCFLFETDVIAILEERGADQMYGYLYAKDYNVSCVCGS
jgi:hypothetical protein